MNQQNQEAHIQSNTETISIFGLCPWSKI